MIKGKRSQEEMVGFVLIIIIVAVISLVLLSLFLKNPKEESVESYEIESFLQSVLQYTSECKDYLGFLSTEELIVNCEEGKGCSNEEDSCIVLNNTLKDLIEKSCVIGENSPIKGYELRIGVDELEKLELKEGSETGNYKGSFLDFARKGKDYEISFNAYY